MLAIQDYLNSIKGQVKTRRERGSKVKEELLKIIKENIEKKIPNTFKQLREQLNVKGQTYLRKVVKNHPEFKIEKVNGVSIVLPTEE